MNRLMAEVLQKQTRSLKRIYLIMVTIVLGTIVVTAVRSPLEGWVVNPTSRLWVEVGLGAFSALLLGLVLPLVRQRLVDPDRVSTVGPDILAKWGLPVSIEPSLGRQAVFLTRYTVGCVISWSLAVAVGFYGLAARMLGSAPAVAGIFLAAAVFVVVLLPPRGGWLREAVERFP